MNDLSEDFKERLKRKKEGLDSKSNPLSLFKSISEEMESEIENNKVLKFKKSLSESRKHIEPKSNIDLSNLFSGLSEIKEEEKVLEIKKEELIDFFSSLAEKQEPLGEEFTEILHENISDLYETEESEIIIPEKEPEIVEEELIKSDLISAAVQSISKEESLKPQDNLPENYTNLFSNPKVEKPDPAIKSLQAKLKYLEEWISKISMAGPGGGEVNFRYLDDVDPNSIGKNKYLTYNQDNRKFYFDYVTSNTIVNNTTLVTSNNYISSPEDYYIGVNFAGPTYITIPTSAQPGKIMIIKDESGNCSNNPIIVSGNVDNDAGGFILRINNGAIQMIYRNGWRII